MSAHVPDTLEDLDGERPAEPFTVGFGGRTVVFRPAVGPGWRDLMEAMAWPPAFMETFGPDDPGDVTAVEALPIWQMRAVLRGWRVHHGLCPSNADNTRLASMLNKTAYRDAAERDLWEVHHLDLTREWQARRWRRLLNLLDGFRRTSHIHEAMAQDDEIAEMWLEREQRGEVPESKPKRRLLEYSVEAELMSTAVDRLGELIMAQATGKGAKRRRVEPMPRPETAMHRVREKRAQRKHKYTVARVYGYIDDKGQPTGKGPVPEGTPTTP